ncbi:MAG TPA: hypothetical protein VIH42_03550 [Thermoguttaceae bacterium]
MTHEEFSELLRREEAKRNRMWDPIKRWQMIQDMITWADAQRPIPRNSRQGCLANQRRLLGRMK